MKAKVPQQGWWNRMRDRFRRTPQSEADGQLRSDVNRCISLLNTSSRRGVQSDMIATMASSTNCNAFGWRLLRLLGEPQSRNIFVSPCGIRLALAMTYNGARGETQAAMARTLGLGNISLEEVNRASENLMKALTLDTSNTQVCIANSLWVAHLDRMLPEFIQGCQRYYAADIGDLQGGTGAINAWVRRQTKGVIDKIVDIADPDTHALLASVVYFHSRWENPFRLQDTRPWPFTRSDGRKTSCQMMFQDGNYLYLRTKTFQAARLPYQDGFCMTVFLPNPGVSPQETIALLMQETWEDWRARFRALDGRVGLPRFRFDYLTNLKDKLAHLGMGVAFDRDLADFSDMSPLFYLDDIQHKVWVEVNEEGTTAAAVTSLVVLCGSIASEPVARFQLILDRPFICTVEDEQTGVLLFLGLVTTLQFKD